MDWKFNIQNSIKMKVSIVTCTYNSAATVADTINSVNSQTYPDIEHIIVDGVSKDNTVEIANKLSTYRQHVICEKDKGIYDAFNKGIKAATGDIVGVLNSDDFFTSSDVVANIVKAFEGNDIDAVYGDVHFVNANDLSKPVRYYSSAYFRPWMMRMGFMFAHPSFYVKKSLYDKLGIYRTDFKIASDFELLLRFIYKEKIRTKYLPMDFVTMRTGGASTESMKSKNIINRECLIACRENGVYSNMLLMWCRLFIKGVELVKFKLLK